MDFTVDRSNCYATTPPHVIGTVAIFYELFLPCESQFHRCVPLVNAITWIYIFAENFSVFMVLLPKSETLRFYLEPARTTTNANNRTVT